MAQPLRYGTTADILIGPIIKSTDGYTASTGQTTATVAINFFMGTGKTTGDYSTVNNSWTEVDNGYYWLGLSTVESGNYGPVYIEITASSGIPFAQEFTVVDSKTYDALIKGTGTDLLDVNAEQINGGDATGANINVGAVAGTTVGGTTDLKDNLTTASNMNIGAVAGTTVAGTTAFQADVSNLSTLTTANSLNVGALAGTTLGANVSSGYIQADTPNAPTTSQVLTTASNVNVGAVAGTTVAGTTAFQADVSNLSTLTTASSLNIGAVAGTTVAGTTAFQADVTDMSTFDAGSETVSIASGTTVAANVLYVNTSGVTYLSTFSPDSDDIGGMTARQALKYIQTYCIGDFSVTGASTNVAVYDDYAGTTHFAHTFTTKERSFSS